MSRRCWDCEHAILWREHPGTVFDCAKLNDDWHTLTRREFETKWPIGYDGLPRDGSYAKQCTLFKEYIYTSGKDPRFITPIIPMEAS